jgi:hypothetical protein
MRTLLVYGSKTFKIDIPDDAKVTFGPFSPPKSDKGDGFGREDSKRGTLRVYAGPTIASTMLACFSHVDGFRDLSVGYAEEVAKEEGATIWKDDERGYVRESKVSRTNDWIDDPVQKITGKKKS